MKRIYWTLFCASLLVMTICSCSHKKEVKETVEKFASAWKCGDAGDMQEVYPRVSNLPSYYKSDEVTIKDVKSNKDEEYEVLVHNKFTNGFGKLFEKDITFFVAPRDKEDLEKGFIISDSKGLCSYTETDDIAPYYNFAKSVGAMADNANTDQKIMQSIKNAMPLFFQYKEVMKEYLVNNLTFSSLNWHTGYGMSYATGTAVCTNNTGYDIPNLKYIVKFMRSKGGEVITQEDGYISYGNFKAGASTSFSFYSSYVGNAGWAEVEPELDDDFITKAVANSRYDGNEYANSLK